jgi:formate hydrogenlyase transcriptional activator
MSAKAQIEARGLTASPTPAVSEFTPASVNGDEAREVTAGSHEILRNVDAAWLFESLPDAVVLVDGQSRIVVINGQTEKMFGYRREELVGEPVEKLMPEWFQNGHTEHRSRYGAAPHGSPMGAGLELFGRHRDGHKFPIETSLAPVETKDGVLISSAIREVSELKRTQDLRSSLEFEKLMSRLSKMFINMSIDCIDREVGNGLKDLAEVLDLDRVSINLIDPDKKSRTISHSWAKPGIPPAPLGEFTELFPWEAGLIAKHEMCCVSTPEDLPTEAVAERTYMLAEGLKSWLTIPLQVGGTQLGGMGTSMFRRQQTWDSLSISRFQQAGDLFAGVLARKRAAEAQSESEERFRTVADTAPVLIWMSGTDKLCTFFNQGWLAFTGRAMEEELGKGWASGVHPEDLNRCLETYSAEFDARSEFTLEYRLRRHDGDYRWLVDRGVPRFETSGRFLGYIGSCVDITERKLSEQALAEQSAFEALLAELSAKFINLPTKDVDGQIKESQKRICETLGLDRSTLFQVSPESNNGTITHSWAAEGFEPNRRVSGEDFPWIVRTVLGGRRVSFRRIDDLPEEAAKDKKSLRQHGPKSKVAFPLSAGGRVIGGLAFGALREERDWPALLLERLGMAAQIFANALARARADEELHQAYKEIEELKHRIEKENIYLREEVKLEHHHNEVIGDSEGIRRVLKKAEQVAPTDSTVLVLGETGTGKELVARTIHEHSRRKDRVMVKVNCAALPASLIESELFGREKGAFTGALTKEIGRFELANGSTILLDEVAELPVELQSKLLRVLQEGEFERLGGPKTIKVDVRVIAATSKNLQQAVRDGKFREDLFYRLNVFPITIPPLRERREDIPSLVWHFVNELSQRMGRSIETIQGSTMEAFKSYSWPGNVRELRNVIERFLITSTNTVFRAKFPTGETAAANGHSQTFEEVDRNHILHVMEMVGWRVRGEGGAAQILGLKPTTLESRMQKLGIVRPK